MTTSLYFCSSGLVWVGKGMENLISYIYSVLSDTLLEKEMATHSSILAWRIPGMGEPVRLPSVGLHRVRHDWSDLAAAAAEWYTITD